jgi:DNA-binding beta-propeller fold protein YncE
MKKISLAWLSRAILSAGLAGAVIAPNVAQAGTPKNEFLTFIYLIDQTTGDFCIPATESVTKNNEKVYVAANDPITGNAEVFALNALDDTITASIILVSGGDYFAFGTAINPAGNFAFVSVEGISPTTGLVFVIYTPINSIYWVFGTTFVGPFPEGLAVNKDGTYLWVANSGTGPFFNNGTVTVDSIASDGYLFPVDLIPTGGSPDQVVFSPKQNLIYALNGNPLVGYVSVIDTTTGDILNNSFGSGIIGFPFYSLSTSKKQVFIANFAVSVANLNLDGTVKAIYDMFEPFQTDTELGQTAVTTNGAFLFVAEPEASSIGWVDIKTNTPESLSPIFTGGFPYYIAISPDDSKLYESDLINDGVGVIDIQQ